ncbi:hypothetical protein HPB49_021292 [Dermacentor silvarum]|uniref:Uncharacterized protein n=1 Tax=Dermacentor silvarum TaxID=543639 RepID=A0ACB8E368_DERSI|nr:hypothetical protein HPB49_021292 [Dermacentor silvarum]
MLPTFSRLGSEECPGVVSLMPSKLYQCVDKQRSDGQTCDVAVTCLEVYKKVVRDLLCLDPAKGIAILYLAIHKVKEAGTLLEPLLKGKKPTQHATDANAESSWSHAIFQSYITVTENATSTSKEIRVSMCSADLDGSERAAATSRDTKDQMRKPQGYQAQSVAPGPRQLHRRPLEERDAGSAIPGLQADPHPQASLGGSVSTFMIGTATAVKLSYAETCNILEYVR